MISPIIENHYKKEEELTYYSILPTATHYARNSMFSGLMQNLIGHPFDTAKVLQQNGKSPFLKNPVHYYRGIQYPITSIMFLQGINSNNNKSAMAKFHGKKPFNKQLYEGFDNFFCMFQADNEYEVYIRQLQHIYLVQQVCKQYGVKLVLFMWHPLPKRPSVLYDAWDRLIDWDRIISPSVIEWQTVNKMKPRKITVDGYHLNSETSKQLVTDLLKLS